MTKYFVSGTTRKAHEFRRALYDEDPERFPEDVRYRERRKGAAAVAWTVLGWECETDEDTAWSGCVNRTNTVLAIMVGDDTIHRFEAYDLIPIAREAYCGSCGQIGCCADGLER